MPRVAITGERHEQTAYDRRDHHGDGDPHGQDPFDLARAHGLHDVEGDGAVFELLNQVPREEGSGRFRHLPGPQLVLDEGVLGDHRGPVLDRSRDGNLETGGEPRRDREGDGAGAVDPCRRVAESGEGLVELVVLALVQALLTDEPLDLVAQRAVEPVPLASDHVGEEPLARRDHPRQGCDEVAAEQVVVEPVPVGAHRLVVEGVPTGRHRSGAGRALRVQRGGRHPRPSMVDNDGSDVIYWFTSRTVLSTMGTLRRGRVGVGAARGEQHGGASLVGHGSVVRIPVLVRSPSGAEDLLQEEP